MSKLIVEMDMPKGCYFCPMSATYPTDWYCMAYDNTKSIEGCAPMNKRPDWCPIKGVLPDEHGDLIDRDKAKDAFDSSFLTFRMKDGETMKGFYQRTIDELPTVIVAERRDDAK